MENNVFKTLNSINVNGMVDKKTVGGSTLTYLSWADAWKVAKEHYPDISYEVERNQTGLPYFYDPITGYMVFTKVTIEGQTHEMFLSVMDGTNHAMLDHPYEVQTKYKKFTVGAATMTDINKTIMRCLVKNLAMHGLALYLYQGDELPDTAQQAQPVQAIKPVEKATPAAQQQAPVNDKRKLTDKELAIVKKVIEKYGISEDFICAKYKIQKFEDIMLYQARHIDTNIKKLSEMYEAEKPKQVEQPKQEEQPEHKAEVVNLEDIGISDKDLDEITKAFA